MLIDNYTKLIMTVIAGALVVIALKEKGIIPTATAQSSGVQKIAICEVTGMWCADVLKGGDGGDWKAVGVASID